MEDWAHYSDLAVIFGMAVFIILSEYSFIKLTYNWVRCHVKDQDNPTLAHSRTLKATKKMFATFYFAITVAYGYHVLKDSLWLPWYMGGNHPDGAVDNVFVNIPFTPVVPGAKWYALTTMGYHLGDLFMHLFVHERQNDFKEMLLHHLCAVLLYALMIYGNMLGIGCLIIFLHDIADIFASAVKGFS